MHYRHRAAINQFLEISENLPDRSKEEEQGLADMVVRLGVTEH